MLVVRDVATGRLISTRDVVVEWELLKGAAMSRTGLHVAVMTHHTVGPPVLLSIVPLEPGPGVDYWVWNATGYPHSMAFAEDGRSLVIPGVQVTPVAATDVSDAVAVFQEFGAPMVEQSLVRRLNTTIGLVRRTLGVVTKCRQSVFLWESEGRAISVRANRPYTVVMNGEDACGAAIHVTRSALDSRRVAAGAVLSQFWDANHQKHVDALLRDTFVRGLVEVIRVTSERGSLKPSKVRLTCLWGEAVPRLPSPWTDVGGATECVASAVRFLLKRHGSKAVSEFIAARAATILWQDEASPSDIRVDLQEQFESRFGPIAAAVREWRAQEYTSPQDLSLD